MANPIEELIFFNKLSETATVLGKKVKWHTLDGDEHLSAMSASARAMDDLTRLHLFKIEKLSRAIETIDGIPWMQLIKDEEKDRTTPTTKAREVIGKWQKSVIDYFYYQYEQLEVKANNELQKMTTSFFQQAPNITG